MTLSKQEKVELKSLTEHRWFKVLEELVKDMETELFTQFKTANLSDTDVWLKLNWVQNKLAWAEYLINIAKSKSQDIVDKKIK